MFGVTYRNNKFEWMLKNIRLEKIISAPIWATILFSELSALLDVRHCPKLQSCAISRKTNDATLRTPPPPPPPCQIFFSWVLPPLVVRQCSKPTSYAFSWKTKEPNLKK